MPRIRIRGPNGVSTVTLSEKATAGDLLREIRANTSLTKFDVKYGYPPQPLILDSETTPLANLEVSLNGEQLTISSKEDTPPPTTKPQASVSSSHMTYSNSITDISKDSISSKETKSNASGPIPLKRKDMGRDVPELPMPSRGSTLGKYSTQTSPQSNRTFK